jgi:hypothetical protein
MIPYDATLLPPLAQPAGAEHDRCLELRSFAHRQSPCLVCRTFFPGESR